MDRRIDLICEGRCNPGLPSLDEERREATAQLKKPSWMWLSMHRQLKHTPHTERGRSRTGGIWECQQCGARRRY